MGKILRQRKTAESLLLFMDFFPPLVLLAQTPKTNKGDVDRLAGSLICSSLVLLIHHAWPLGRPQSDLKTLEFHKNSILNTSCNTSSRKHFSSLENRRKSISWKDLRATTKLLTQKAAKQVGWKEVWVPYSRRTQRRQSPPWYMFRNYIPLEEKCQETKFKNTDKQNTGVK